MLLLSPYLWPYLKVHESMGFARSVDEAEAAQLDELPVDGGQDPFQRLEPLVRARGDVEHVSRRARISARCPGLLRPRQHARCPLQDVRHHRRRLRGSIVRAGIAVLSLLHAAIPLFQTVRVLPHIGEVVLLMVAVLAGFGVASIQKSWNARTLVARGGAVVRRRQRRGGPRADRLCLVRSRTGCLRCPCRRTERRRRGTAVPDAAAVVSQHALHGQFDAALAAAAEWLQRISAGLV